MLRISQRRKKIKIGNYRNVEKYQASGGGGDGLICQHFEHFSNLRFFLLLSNDS